jgi:hypothetical protein
MNEPGDNPHLCDLEKFRKTAKSKRELAWELLKQTRNPTYVAMRYGYSIAAMEEALKKVPQK